MFAASPYWIRFTCGRFGVLWLFPWGWLYDWRSFLWGYAPDDESWWMRICGVEIFWMRRSRRQPGLVDKEHTTLAKSKEET